MSVKKKESDWSIPEIKAAVDAYLEMLALEKKGQKFVKTAANISLRETALPTRTKGSVEFRMQNISTVLMKMDREFIKGYKPARNVGANVEQSIRAVLSEKGIQPGDPKAPTADEETLERRAAALQKQKIKEPPKGIKKPTQAASSRTVYFRDPEVRAWVRNEAEGHCNGCGEPAPFQKFDLPYLEVHHVKPLAEKGSDQITNAVALCPNCHRRCHYSNDREAFTASLYLKVGRLIPE
ncbi:MULTISPECIES: HNH endonuclease signature motif containing protein [unclassified Pseudomonas]|uniref:HNH endonuclease n=1 Tax=unclassified Pseudomonas TaxID=196821 RepID=UPI002AC8DCCA|nr:MULTISPECIES: HNH endonuclease signature motif containing protein [unclassified Pseudomonas]MEB0047887.1 HNH endonuclease signature motif containing protein [Pseudomonas sp. Dout3]MEB0098962.1 HNH endonuclease signature motif containing protein [Pseudomonas sp. DC1.2]WPX57602.1 HNH endonuclease signature motif containing protein [Pseudomonas sp. DC1.2]